MAMPSAETRSLALLGYGNMGEAILTALVRHESAGRGHVYVHDANASRREALPDARFVSWAPSALDAARDAHVLLLAVKPQSMRELLMTVGDAARGRLLVSIAAGITTTFIESLAPGARVVRTMPNTPLLAGRGVVALGAGRSASAEDVTTAKRLFPGATLLEVCESQMDAITAVSGSGPAYFFAFVEALAAAAEAQGFDRATAYRLAAGTFTGAAALLEQSDADAAELRRRVTSPGGTTEAALKVFADEDLPALVRAAVAAATARGGELSGAVSPDT